MWLVYLRFHLGVNELNGVPSTKASPAPGSPCSLLESDGDENLTEPELSSRRAIFEVSRALEYYQCSQKRPPALETKRAS